MPIGYKMGSQLAQNDPWIIIVAAFILGLVPLVFAQGAGAGSRHSIGISVFGGMMAVAFLGSILVPAFFVATNVMKEKTAKYINKLRNKG